MRLGKVLVSFGGSEDPLIPCSIMRGAELVACGWRGKSRVSVKIDLRDEGGVGL